MFDVLDFKDRHPHIFAILAGLAISLLALILISYTWHKLEIVASYIQKFLPRLVIRGPENNQQEIIPLIDPLCEKERQESKEPSEKCEQKDDK